MFSYSFELFFLVYLEKYEKKLIFKFMIIKIIGKIFYYIVFY